MDAYNIKNGFLLKKKIKKLWKIANILMQLPVRSLRKAVKPPSEVLYLN